jgi:hypothetical protein
MLMPAWPLGGSVPAARVPGIASSRSRITRITRDAQLALMKLSVAEQRIALFGMSLPGPGRAYC